MGEKAAEAKLSGQTEKIGVFEKVAYGGGDLASNLFLHGCAGAECGDYWKHYDVFEAGGRVHGYFHGLRNGSGKDEIR